MNIVNSYHDKIVFVPACLLCPQLMAKKPKSPVLWKREIVSYLMENDYSVIQMPCPEASFPGYDIGIKRSPHGIKYYGELDGYKNHCFHIAQQVITQVDAFYNSGYMVSAIFGIEQSPTCAVNYVYTHRGNQKGQGIFIQCMADAICTRKYNTLLIGINRRYPQKAIRLLMEA